MSNTGTYKLIDGKMVKVSDKTPNIKGHMWYPKRSQRSHGGYHDEHLGDVFVESKEHKRQIMKEQHLAEAG
jgi:hypothetical protein